MDEKNKKRIWKTIILYIPYLILWRLIYWYLKSICPQKGTGEVFILSVVIFLLVFFSVNFLIRKLRRTRKNQKLTGKKKIKPINFSQSI